MHLARTIPLTLLFLAVAACHSGSATPNVAAPDPLAKPLPFDPRVRTGTLENGLTYYVEQNAEPQSRAELRLVVKAGSINESDDQLGLAHVVEHMAFNGTEHFSGNELVAYIESVGLRFGHHLNAYTSFDETVYQLQVPTDDPKLLDQGLLVLSDWASGILFAEEEIEKERGVVLEEWRRTLGAGGRLRDKMLPLTFRDSLYKDRIPIGTEESLRGFDREKLVRFYQDWYRPELMAVVAVGDFDPAAVEKKIAETFAAIPGHSERAQRTYEPVPTDHPTLFGIFVDPEIPQTTVDLTVKTVDREG
ncbi:MAG: pitrilysin family protein, partial [Myxococcota bacterium]